MRLVPLTLRLAGLACLAMSFPGTSRAQALFAARDVVQERFVLVAAPIGDGSRSQLNIYEQINDRRPCFASSGASPAMVDPLLGSFDFTGICSRYLDANGYSLRVGETDLGTVYRISVVRSGNDNLLLAAPTRNNSGPEMIVARTNGHGAGFLLFNPEPGWRLMRRHFGDRALGHLYLYRETWPGAENPKAEVPPSTEAGPGTQVVTPKEITDTEITDTETTDTETTEGAMEGATEETTEGTTGEASEGTTTEIVPTPEAAPAAP